MDGLTNLETLAVAKCVKSTALKQARDGVEPGKYEVNSLVRISGEVRVGEDYEAKKTAAMPQKKMLLAALKLNGVSVKKFMREYIDGEHKVSPEDEKELETMWNELAAEFVDTKRGRVDTKLSIEKVTEADQVA